MAPGENNISPVAGLRFIANDLFDLAKSLGVAGAVELWESDDCRGFFIGDTSNLPDEGWTYLATL